MNNKAAQYTAKTAAETAAEAAQLNAFRKNVFTTYKTQIADDRTEIRLGIDGHGNYAVKVNDVITCTSESASLILKDYKKELGNHAFVPPSKAAAARNEQANYPPIARLIVVVADGILNGGNLNKMRIDGEGTEDDLGDLFTFFQ